MTVRIDGELAATSASTVGTLVLLNLVGIYLAIFPRPPRDNDHAAHVHDPAKETQIANATAKETPVDNDNTKMALSNLDSHVGSHMVQDEECNTLRQRMHQTDIDGSMQQESSTNSASSEEHASAAAPLASMGAKGAKDGGMLTQTGIQICSRLAALVFFPALNALNVGRIKNFSEVWPVAFWHFGTISINLCLSWLLIRPLKIPKGFHAAFVAGSSYGNIGALAYVMMQPELAGEDNCWERASGFIAVAIFSWHVMFWTLGEYLLTHENDENIPEVINTTTWKERCNWTIKRICHPNIIAILIGLVVANIQYLQDLFFLKDPDAEELKRPPLSFITSALHTLGSSSVGLITIVMAGTIGKRITKFKPGWLRNILGQTVSDKLVETFKLKHGTFALAQSAPAILISNVIDVDLIRSSSTKESISPDCSSKDPTDDDEHSKAFTASLLAKIIIVRVVVIAFVQFMLTFALSDIIFPDSSEHSKLIRLILFIQAVTPSANLSVAACQQAGRTIVAEAMAMSIFFQQMVVAVIMIPSTAIAISIVYRN